MLDERFPEAAPFGEAEEARPLRLHHGRGASALVMSAARARAWLEGWARLEGSPLCPALLGRAPGAVLVEPFGEAVDPRPALLGQPWERRTLSGARRELLAGLCPGLDPSRALARWLPRRRVDRFLGREVTLEVRVGRGFGGLRAAHWRRGPRGPIGLRCELAREDAWLEEALAALAIDRDHTPSGDPEAWRLASLAVLLREAARGPEPALGERAAALVPRERAPDRVRVRVEGHACLEACFEAPGTEVSARRARWLLQHLDGLWVAGVRTRVVTTPPIRAGRRPPRREPARARRRRLFSRWHEGVRVDEEGLVGLTPEALALRIAGEARGVVIDGTCGVGGLAIALARQEAVERVIAVDVDAARLEMARHNARLYGVEGRIEWVRGEAADVVAGRRADLLVLDPPWGGRGYDRARVALEELGMDVAGLLRRFEGPVWLKLPRSFDPGTLPGAWTLELMLDDREIPKLLLARRG